VYGVVYVILDENKSMTDSHKKGTGYFKELKSKNFNMLLLCEDNQVNSLLVETEITTFNKFKTREPRRG